MPARRQRSGSVCGGCLDRLWSFITTAISRPEARLHLPRFSTQLATLLAQGRKDLCVAWLGISELASPAGRIVPCWRCYSGDLPPARELTLTEFEWLATREAGIPLVHSDLEVLGTWLGDAAVTAFPLAVLPCISVHPDALLFLVQDGEPPAAAALAAFRGQVEVLLSEDRRARFGGIFFAAVEQAADPIELTDRDARLFYVNKAWEQLTGYAAAEVLGRTVGQIFRDSETPMHDPAFYQFTMAELHAGRSWMGALAGRVRDGRRIFTEVSVAPFAAESAGFLGHAAIRRSLEHRQDREAALAVAHREFRTVLSGIPDGVCVLRDGRIYFANAAFLGMLKLSEAGVIGRDFAEFVHPDDRAQFESEHETKVTRVRVTPADGLPRFVEISAAGAVSFEGKPAMILLSRDTTDYQLAREELSRTEKLSALGSLAAGVAHELNNPLAYVALNLELLAKNADKWLPKTECDALHEAIEGIQRLRDITGELRAFSGTDRPGQAEPVDVSRAVTSALNIAQNEIRHRARLVRDLEDGLFVLAREGQLVQVLVNVLVNAAQAIVATRIEGQVIAVRSRRAEGGVVEIVVSDTGAGIPDSLLPQLFAPFTTSKRRGEGSGLGLAICNRIVTGFGGQIRINSSVGKGTQVTIVLNETSRAPTPKRPPGVANVGAPHRPRRVLIVDDEASIARALKRVLTGHDISVAADGHAALRMLENDPHFDVVLCDLMMPGLSGEALHEEARRRDGALAKRFVFMTGGALITANAEFLRNSGCAVLLKPFDPSDVLERIEETARQANLTVRS